MILTAALESKCTAAVARAAAYIRGRQSPSGGFCFYRHGPVEEPSLGDTYYAVSGLELFDLEVPNARGVAEYVCRARIFGLTYLYFCAFTLDRLGLASRLGAEALAQIDALAVRLPGEGRSDDWTDTVDRGAWLESVRKTIRLQRRFGSGETENAPSRATANDYAISARQLAADRDRSAPVARFIGDLLARGGFGVRINLWDTYLALAIGSLLGIEATADTASFVDSLQEPPFGFLMTPRSAMPSLDVVYAGVRCCKFLKLPIRYEREALAFLLACQTSDGGFSHAPTALPNLEFTYRGLQTLALLAPELARRDVSSTR